MRRPLPFDASQGHRGERLLAGPHQGNADPRVDQTRARRRANRLNVKVRKSHALPVKAVEHGSADLLVPVAAKVALTLIVRQDQNQVGPAAFVNSGRRGIQARQRDGRRPKSSQKLSSCGPLHPSPFPVCELKEICIATSEKVYITTRGCETEDGFPRNSGSLPGSLKGCTILKKWGRGCRLVMGRREDAGPPRCHSR